MKESDLELDCKNLAEAMGWVVYKGSGRIGAPDKIFLKQGKGFTAETKTAIGVLRKEQKREQKYLEKRAVPYYLVRCLEDFRTAILTEEGKLKWMTVIGSVLRRFLNCDIDQRGQSKMSNDNMKPKYKKGDLVYSFYGHVLEAFTVSEISWHPDYGYEYSGLTMNHHGSMQVKEGFVFSTLDECISSITKQLNNMDSHGKYRQYPDELAKECGS